MPPLRVMLWNIQDLRIGKLNPAPHDPNRERAAYIVDSVMRTNPSIVVVVEIETGWPAPGLSLGYLVTPDQGGEAAAWILDTLRNAQPLRDWRLVPPVISGGGGKKEGIAVFFDNNQVNFRGPHRLENTVIRKPRGDPETFQRSDGLGPGASPPYNAPWNQALPATQPGGGLIVSDPGFPALNQNQLSGKPYFGAQTFGGFAPLAFPTLDCRSPFFTSFWEVAPPNRTFNLLSVHLPPNASEAGKAVTNIMKIAEITAPLAQREVRMVLGDFNIDHRSESEIGHLRPLKTHPISREIGGSTRFELANFIGATQLKPVNEATPTGNPPYPGYVNHPFWGPYDQLPAYDYIYVAYGEDPPDPGEAPFGRVIDRVIGTPWLAPEIPPGMQTGWQNIRDTPLFPPPGPTELFQQIQNYGKIRGASDHMAVFADL